MPIIIDVYAREVIDSRGNPTIEVEVQTDSGAFGAQANRVRDAAVRH